VPTTIILVRCGETAWREQGRLLGRRDIGLTEPGKAEVRRGLALLDGVAISEILASPLSRAVQTAEVFAQHYQIGVGRDPRLLELDVGPWEGSVWADLVNRQEFHDFVAGEADSFPDGENLDAARRRAISSVEQAVADNSSSAVILIATHGFIVSLILAHYLGMPSSTCVRLQANPGSLSLLRFVSEMQQPEVLGVNLAVPLPEMIDPARD
jgi:broad specificity phosphatase PhoE